MAAEVTRGGGGLAPSERGVFMHFWRGQKTISQCARLSFLWDAGERTYKWAVWAEGKPIST